MCQMSANFFIRNKRRNHSMKTAELAIPVKGTSWPILISQVEIGEQKRRGFPVEKGSSIRPVISGILKLRYPERTYSAKKELFNGKLAIVVRRIR